MLWWHGLPTCAPLPRNTLSQQISQQRSTGCSAGTHTTEFRASLRRHSRQSAACFPEEHLDQIDGHTPQYCRRVDLTLTAPHWINTQNLRNLYDQMPSTLDHLLAELSLIDETSDAGRRTMDIHISHHYLNTTADEGTRWHRMITALLDTLTGDHPLLQQATFSSYVKYLGLLPLPGTLDHEGFKREMTRIFGTHAIASNDGGSEDR